MIEVVRCVLRWGRLRSAWVVVGLLWLLLFYDFAMRPFAGRDATLRSFSAPPVATVPTLPQPPDVEAALKGWFPVVGPPKAAPKKLALQAVWGAAGKLKAVIAVFSAEGAFETRRVMVMGESVEGWKISQIDRSSVTLVRDDESQETKLLKMFPSRAGVSP